MAAMAEMAPPAAPVIASGGVTTLDDVRRLAELPLAGCIVGGPFTKAAGFKRNPCDLRRKEEYNEAWLSARGLLFNRLASLELFMANYRVEDIRTVALVGHEVAGKTSLADALLFKAKAVDAGAASTTDQRLRFRRRGKKTQILHRFSHPAPGSQGQADLPARHSRQPRLCRRGPGTAERGRDGA